MSGVTTVDSDPVLLSLDPRWADAIRAGEKRYEYRRVAPAQEPPYSIVLYATAPRQAVVASAVVDAVIEADIEALIDRTVDGTPHGRADVRDYFEGRETGTALELGEIAAYETPVSRERLREVDPGFTVPQNFRYLRADETEVRALVATDRPAFERE